MQFLHLLFLLPAAATCYILQQEPHNVHHLPAPPHLIQRRDRADYEAWKNPRPWNAHESKTNPNIPANIDHRQRAREDFLESTTREYGTKPSKLVNGRRPMKDTGPSKKRVAEARDNGRRKQENDRMSTEDQEIDQIVVGKPTPVLELGFGESPLSGRGGSINADHGDRL
jgi:hypothetical protein